MQIICKHCKTSHYLSDDKIPLETKTGKCKQCGSPITVLGKNALHSTDKMDDLIIVNPTTVSATQEETKRSLYMTKK